MNAISANIALVIVFAGVLIMGLALIARAIISLLRSFTPGRQSRPAAASPPLLSRAAGYSLGLGAAVLGAVGLIALLLFDVAPETSVLVGLGTGLVVALIALILLVYWPSRGEVEKALLDFDATGHRAQVVIDIPPNGLGEITFRDGQERVNLGARSAAGLPIGKGTTVVIERVTRRVAVVSPLDDDSGPVK
ncbi:MAG: hypothetical protein KIS95_03865 [Anaerolineae bacterium]|uniref:hypothetical protein n=1 Tax=Promineifilum sp. TaxID=2664178 RepID=UPI001D456E38|nr:hypothetical protein [Anaerolineales bacterium]MCB8933870.1 hypothetical protein [Promineifilum sp.]MCO5181377.1 hypothetical protein [Promineifilum sp.]MCW5846343.1 hypothetical protein [Anaerolineae bacterium]